MGLDPKKLVACLLKELTRAATRASHLEINLNETSRELDIIRELLNRAEERANSAGSQGCLELPGVRSFSAGLLRSPRWKRVRLSAHS